MKTRDTTYNGTVNITQSNLPCKRWENAESKVYHAFEENFCRNPFFDALDYPWCYTQSGNPRYDVCAIPLCGMLLFKMKIFYNYGSIIYYQHNISGSRLQKH